MNIEEAINLEISKKKLSDICEYLEHCTTKELEYFNSLTKNKRFSLKIKSDRIYTLDNIKNLEGIMNDEYYLLLCDLINENPKLKFKNSEYFNKNFITDLSLADLKVLESIRMITYAFKEIIEICGFSTIKNNYKDIKKIISNYLADSHGYILILRLYFEQSISLIFLEKIIEKKQYYIGSLLGNNTGCEIYYKYSEKEHSVFLCKFEYKNFKIDYKMYTDVSNKKNFFVKKVDISKEVKILENFRRRNRNKEALKKYFQILLKIDNALMENGFYVKENAITQKVKARCQLCGQSTSSKKGVLCKDCKNNIKMVGLKVDSIERKAKRILKTKIRNIDKGIKIKKFFLKNFYDKDDKLLQDVTISNNEIIKWLKTIKDNYCSDIATIDEINSIIKK